MLRRCSSEAAPLVVYHEVSIQQLHLDTRLMYDLLTQVLQQQICVAGHSTSSGKNNIMIDE
jgi:hypothetical protein